MVPQRRRGRVEAEVHEVVDSGIGTGRLVEHGVGAGDLKGAGGRAGLAQVLPDPPGPVDLAVVQPEQRVVGAVEDVAAGVAAPREVAGRVQAQVVVGEVALQPVLEGSDGGRVDRVREQRDRLLCWKQSVTCTSRGECATRNTRFRGKGTRVDRDTHVVRRPLRSDPRRNVTTHAARKVAEKLADGNRVRSRTKGRACGRDVGNHLAVGARLDAAATFTGRNAHSVTRERVRAVVRREDAVAALGKGSTIHIGGVDGVQGRLAPVQVGLVAAVAALIAQRRLPGIDKVPVPCQEVSGGVDRHGLVDVRRHEVVVPGPRPGNGLGRRDGRLAHHAADSLDVVKLLLVRQSRAG